MKKAFLFSLLAVVSIFLGSKAGAASLDHLAPVSMSVAHNNAGFTVTSFIGDELKRLLEQKSGGKISVTIYPAGQMGSERETQESTQEGNLTFILQTAGVQVGMVPDAMVFDMPFLFKNSGEARKVIDTPAFRELLNDSYRKAGVELVMISDQGFRELSTNRKIESYESLTGMNLRTMANPIHIAFWKAMGVNPTPLNQSEVFISLQQGMIDGQENPYITIDNFKLQEVQKYIVDTHHIFHTVTLVGNKPFLDALAPEYKAILKEAVDEILASSRKMSDDTVAEYLQKLINDGMTYIAVDTIPGLREKMQNATKDTDKLIRQTVRNELVDAYLKAAGR